MVNHGSKDMVSRLVDVVTVNLIIQSDNVTDNRIVGVVILVGVASWLCPLPPSPSRRLW